MEYLWLTGLGIYDLMGGAFISLNGWGIYITGVGHLWPSGWGVCHLMARAFVT